MTSTIRDNIFYFAAIFIALMLIYSPCLFINYVFHDEMLFLVKGDNRFALHPHFNLEISIGRPANALLLTIYSWFINSPRDIALTRWICLIEFAICAYFFMSLLQKIFDNRIMAFLSAIIIFTLPPFEVFMSWSGNVNWHTAMFLSSVAAMILYKKSNDKPWLSIRNFFNPFFISSLVFLLTANLIYPASATFYWACLVLIILSMPLERLNFKKIADFYTVGFAALGLYGLSLKILKLFYAAREGLYNPYQFASDISGKFDWFVKEPLLNALNLHSIFPDQTLTIGLSIFTGSSFLIWLITRKLKGRHVLLVICAIAPLLFLCYLPNLLAGQNAPFYRCSSALTTLISVFFLVALYQCVALIPKNARNMAGAVIFGGILLWGAPQAYFNILNYRVIPSVVEFAYVQSIMSNINLSKYQHIDLTRPLVSFTEERYDEFGILTTNNLHAIPIFFVTAAKEAGQTIDFSKLDLCTHFIEKDKERYPTIPEKFFQAPAVHVFLKGQEMQINMTVPGNFYHSSTLQIDMASFVESLRRTHRR